MSAEGQTGLFSVSGYYESQSSRDKRLGLDELERAGSGNRDGQNGASAVPAETAVRQTQRPEDASARERLEAELEMDRAIGSRMLADTEISLL